MTHKMHHLLNYHSFQIGCGEAGYQTIEREMLYQCSVRNSKMVPFSIFIEIDISNTLLYIFD